MYPFRRSVFRSLSCTINDSTEKLYKRQQKPGVVLGTRSSGETQNTTVAMRFMISLLLLLHVLRCQTS